MINNKYNDNNSVIKVICTFFHIKKTVDSRAGGTEGTNARFTDFGGTI